MHDVANHTEQRIAYTGTHDNDTLRGWYESLPAARRALVDAALPGVEPEPWWDLIALTFSSRALVAMVQAQDVLGLGSAARMNHARAGIGRVALAAGRAAVPRAGAPATGRSTEAAGRA